MRTVTPSTILFLLLSVLPLKAAELKRDTLQAWDDYVGSVSTSMAERNAEGSRRRHGGACTTGNW